MNNFKFYYETLGGHTHVKLYANGGLCGDLVFTEKEWENFRVRLPPSFAVEKVTGSYTLPSLPL